MALLGGGTTPLRGVDSRTIPLCHSNFAKSLAGIWDDKCRSNKLERHLIVGDTYTAALDRDLWPV